MAKIEQNSVPLSQAWQEHWQLITNGGTDWKSDLEQLILERVTILEFTAPTLCSTETKKSFPGWAEGLQVSVDGKTVSMNYYDLQPLNCPVLFQANTEENPRWNDRHPIDGLNELDQRHNWVRKLWIGDCQKILNRATIVVGTAIRKAVHDAIKDGAFVVLGKPTPSPFDKAKRVPQEAFASPFELNLIRNIIVFDGGSTISSVSLRSVADDVEDQTRSNSYREADLVLVEKMKKFIDDGESIKVKAAAEYFCSEALRKPGTTDNGSVIQRLRRVFGGKYPNYTKKKKPKKLIKTR